MPVSNATPLIYFSKTKTLEILLRVFNKIIIPSGVYNELLRKLKDPLYEEEVLYLKKFIDKGRISVTELNDEGAMIKLKLKESIHGLHYGELEALALAKQLKEKIILVDDKKAIKAAEFFNLIPVRSTVILLKALKMQIINFEKFVEILDSFIECGYWITADIYKRLLAIARNIDNIHMSIFE
ncbi:MAG: hypothetical protein ACP6IU_12790 [Candidatus Asgardarchaeia archaeon]